MLEKVVLKTHARLLEAKSCKSPISALTHCVADTGILLETTPLAFLQSLSIN